MHDIRVKIPTAFGKNGKRFIGRADEWPQCPRHLAANKSIQHNPQDENQPARLNAFCPILTFCYHPHPLLEKDHP